MVPPDSHGVSRVPRYSGASPPGPIAYAYRAVTFFGRPSQGRSASRSVQAEAPPRFEDPSHNPDRPTLAGLTDGRFRLIRVRSPLLAESRLISFPRATEMFHFARFPRARLWIQRAVTRKTRRVAPFGNPRITGCLRLPGAYRSLPRPSSAPGA